MSAVTFKFDDCGVRRVYSDGSSDSIAFEKEQVQSLFTACQQWLAEEAEREQAKINAEKEQRRKQWEELNKEFGGGCVFRLQQDGTWLHEEGDYIVQLAGDGVYRGFDYGNGDWALIEGGRASKCMAVSPSLQEIAKRFGITLQS